MIVSIFSYIWDDYSIVDILIPFLCLNQLFHWTFVSDIHYVSLIGVVSLDSLGYMCLLIAVCPSFARVNSLTIVGDVYCVMALMCVLPDSSHFTVVLIWFVGDGYDFALCYFLLYPYVRFFQCCTTLILL